MDEKLQPLPQDVSTIKDLQSELLAQRGVYQNTQPAYMVREIWGSNYNNLPNDFRQILQDVNANALQALNPRVLHIPTTTINTHTALESVIMDLASQFGQLHTEEECAGIALDLDTQLEVVSDLLNELDELTLEKIPTIIAAFDALTAVPRSEYLKNEDLKTIVEKGEQLFRTVGESLPKTIVRLAKEQSEVCKQNIARAVAEISKSPNIEEADWEQLLNGEPSRISRLVRGFNHAISEATKTQNTLENLNTFLSNFTIGQVKIDSDLSDDILAAERQTSVAELRKAIVGWYFNQEYKYKDELRGLPLTAEKYHMKLTYLAQLDPESDEYIDEIESLRREGLQENHRELADLLDDYFNSVGQALSAIELELLQEDEVGEKIKQHLGHIMASHLTPWKPIFEFVGETEISNDDGLTFRISKSRAKYSIEHLIQRFQNLGITPTIQDNLDASFLTNWIDTLDQNTKEAIAKRSMEQVADMSRFLTARDSYEKSLGNNNQKRIKEGREELEVAGRYAIYNKTAWDLFKNAMSDYPNGDELAEEIINLEKGSRENRYNANAVSLMEKLLNLDSEMSQENLLTMLLQVFSIASRARPRDTYTPAGLLSFELYVNSSLSGIPTYQRRQNEGPTIEETTKLEILRTLTQSAIQRYFYWTPDMNEPLKRVLDATAKYNAAIPNILDDGVTTNSEES